MFYCLKPERVARTWSVTNLLTSSSLGKKSFQFSPASVHKAPTLLGVLRGEKGQIIKYLWLLFLFLSLFFLIKTKKHVQHKVIKRVCSVTFSLQSNLRICTSSTLAFPRGTRGFEISLKTQMHWIKLPFFLELDYNSVYLILKLEISDLVLNLA